MASTVHDVAQKHQRVFTVTDEWYLTGSLQKAGNRFANRFSGRQHATIWKNVRKYQKEGTSLNLNILAQSQIVKLFLKCSF